MTYQRWRSNWGPLAFVWGMWLLFSYYLVDFVRTYGVDCPYFDEWEYVPALTGEQPLTLGWLWSQHNEHRIVVPKLLYLGLASVSHRDFRAGMFFNIAVLSLEAFALIVVARRVRGRTEYSDAFFPLLLLTWGQSENLYASFQLQFLCSSALSVALLVLSVRRARLSSLDAVGLGLCALMLPLVGGNGLALVPAVSVAVLLAGWGEWKRGPGWRRKALGVGAMGLLALAIAAAYFVDYRRPAIPSAKSFDTAMQFLSTGFGESARMVWPESRPIVVAILVSTLCVLVYVALFRSTERARAVRLLFVLGGLVSLAWGIGWPRTPWLGDAFASGYTTLAAPFWCAIYLAWETLGDRQIRRFAQMCLFFFAMALAFQNYDDGKQAAEGHRAKMAAIVDDIRAGVRLPEIVHRHHGFVYYGGEEVLKERMRMLHARSIGVFRHLKE